jgi:hypothetical protein
MTRVCLCNVEFVCVEVFVDSKCGSSRWKNIGGNLAVQPRGSCDW